MPGFNLQGLQADEEDMQSRIGHRRLPDFVSCIPTFLNTRYLTLMVQKFLVLPQFPTNASVRLRLRLQNGSFALTISRMMSLFTLRLA
jgi:hypothetical protein